MSKQVRKAMEKAEGKLREVEQNQDALVELSSQEFANIIGGAILRPTTRSTGNFFDDLFGVEDIYDCSCPEACCGGADPTTDPH